MPEVAERSTVFAMGQLVNVFTEEDRFICVGEIDGIHYPERAGGEEFYDVRGSFPTPRSAIRFDRISEMRLTDA